MLGSIRRPRWATSKEEFSNFIVVNHGRVQAHSAQQAQPLCPWKQTQNVAIVHQARLALLVAQEDCKVNSIRVVVGVGIEDPLQKAQTPTLGIGSSLISACDKRLAHEVGDEQRDTTGSAVLVCRLHHRPQISFGGHMADRVVNEDHVEGSAEAHHSYVALDVLALRI